MQELAARLGEPGSKAETESVLLQMLSSRQLEAEVVEILCIFWMAVRACGYSPTSKLAESTSRSSILSDLVLESCGLLPEGDDEALEEVPEEFEIPQDFDGVQGSDLPRIFRTSWESLRVILGCRSSGRWPLSGRRTAPPTQTLRSKETPGTS
ncbi:hypothetical protein [Stutzerimonas stutzeri]|uniref:hypothetical protein n=1 Tax=Stutzerimonas stutzeri TaxID=316 RepID=UPI0036DECDE6